MFKFSLKGLRFVNYFLVALIVAASLLLIRDILNISLNRKTSLTTTQAERANTIIPNRKDIMYYASILEKNPFGSPMEFYPIAVPQRSDSRQVSLSDLLLIGTVVGPKNLSYAIFENKSLPAPHNQEVFTYGENIYNYGILTKIERESVELKKGSETYTIPLVDIQTRKIQLENTKSTPKTFIKKIGEREYILDRRKVQQALENPEQILTDARLLPNIQNGKQEGFVIYEVKPGGLYESLGLRNGDILLRINGLEISNPEVAIQAMSAFRGMNRINLDIIRNGAKISMNYQIK